MGRIDKLFKKAKNSPENLRFKELCFLAECVGFQFRHQAGSHKIFKHPIINKMLNFQPDKSDTSKAKKYQIKKLVEMIEDFDLMKD